MVASLRAGAQGDEWVARRQAPGRIGRRVRHRGVGRGGRGADRLAPGRLVDDVEYITSPGHAVGSVVTDHGVLTRPMRWARGGRRDEAWTIASLCATEPGQTV